MGPGLPDVPQQQLLMKPTPQQQLSSPIFSCIIFSTPTKLARAEEKDQLTVTFKSPTDSPTDVMDPFV